MTPMRLSFSLLPLCGLLSFATAQSNSCTASEVWEEAPPKAVVEISLAKTRIRACEKTGTRECEWGAATFRITNCGSFPFYIPKTISDVDWHGGFEDIVSGPSAAGALHRSEAADYAPDYRPDVLKEIQESWLLLMPGDFYGGTVRLHTAPLSPGTYKVIGRRNPPILADELRGKLAAALKFPVLLEPINSEPVYLKVLK